MFVKYYSPLILIRWDDKIKFHERLDNLKKLKIFKILKLYKRGNKIIKISRILKELNFFFEEIEKIKNQKSDCGI